MKKKIRTPIGMEWDNRFHSAFLLRLFGRRYSIVLLMCCTIFMVVGCGTNISVTAAAGQSDTPQHEVELNWYAPDSSPSAVVGYNVYRAPDGESSYQLLNSSVESETDYVDSTVKSGLSYDYIVKSVDAFGVESAPSNIANVTIP